MAKGKHVAAPAIMDYKEATRTSVLFDIDLEDYCKCLRGTPDCCPDMLEIVKQHSTNSETMKWCELNLPIFRAIVPNDSRSYKFKRTFKYVGKGPDVLKIMFETDIGLQLKCEKKSEDVARFLGPNNFHTFTLVANVTGWPEDNMVTGLVILKRRNHSDMSSCACEEDSPSIDVDKPSTSSFTQGKKGKFHMNLRSNEDLPAAKRGKFHMNLRSNEDLSAAQTDKVQKNVG